MKYKVIDNFLDEEYFESLGDLFTDKEKKGNNLVSRGYIKAEWYFQSSTVNAEVLKKQKKTESESKFFYFVHVIYEHSRPISNCYNNLLPLLEKLNVRCLLRIQVNLFPNTEILHEHPMHQDYEFSNSTALLSLNTCDGYTKLKDGTKIDSVANRMLLFDPCEEHCSTTTTNVKARFNLNVNYI